MGPAAISSGVENRRTPAGDYTVLEKDIDHESSSYGTVEDGGGKVEEVAVIHQFADGAGDHLRRAPGAGAEARFAVDHGLEVNEAEALLA